MQQASRILGTVVGSTAPLFLAFLAIHVLAGLTAVVAGAIAALAPKGSPRHIRAGRAFYRAITVVFLTAATLTAMRWRQDYHLLIIGTVAFGRRCAASAPTPSGRHRAHRRHGHCLHRHAYRVLRRQRAAPAAVGPPAAADVLVPAAGSWRTHHDQGGRQGPRSIDDGQRGACEW